MLWCEPEAHVSADDTIHLGKGHPSPSLLPAALLQQTIAGLEPDRSRAALQYRGAALDVDFRQSLAAFLTRRYRHPVSADSVLPTSGISLTLGMVCQVFAQPGDVVVCGDPTYFLATAILKTAGLRLVSVPVDAHGLDVAALEAQLAAGLRPRLVYCIPAFHNPAGICLAPERARQLVALAQAYDFRIIADEPYTLLHFGPDPPPCMMSVDGGLGRVISLGSVSKLLAPGLRVGWLHAHPSLIERFCQHGTLRSGGGLNPWMAAAVSVLIADGRLEENIDHLRVVYRQRMVALVGAVRDVFPEARFTAPQGGYFLWAPLPLPLVDEVSVLPGRRCSPSGESGHVRLSVSLYESARLVEGVRRLALRR